MADLNGRRMAYFLKWHETLESLDRLAIGDGGTVIGYGDHAIVAGWYYNGVNENNWYAAIYESETEELDPEAELNLKEISEEFFEDEGHAVEWAIRMINERS